MDIGERKPSIKHFHIPRIKERTMLIFEAVDGLEIDVAILLLKWCSRKFLEQKSNFTFEFLQDVVD